MQCAQPACLWLVQGHVDMVTEKNSDVVHDFFNDPLRLQSDGVWLKVPVLLHALYGVPALANSVAPPCSNIVQDKQPEDRHREYH